MLFRLLSIAILGIIIFQDLKQRSVYTALFFLLFATHTAIALTTISIRLFFCNFVFCALFLLLELAVVRLWMELRKKKMYSAIGLGDILFFIAIMPLFSFIDYILFFIAALLFSILVWITVKKKTKYPTVPLAGYMAIPLLLLHLTVICCPLILKYLQRIFLYC